MRKTSNEDATKNVEERPGVVGVELPDGVPESDRTGPGKRAGHREPLEALHGLPRLGQSTLQFGDLLIILHRVPAETAFNPITLLRVNNVIRQEG